MTDWSKMSTAEMVEKAVAALEAPPKHRTVSTVAGTFRVRQDSRRVLILPNGQKVLIETDASGTATQVHEDHRLHAIARPATVRTVTRTPSPGLEVR